MKENFNEFISRLEQQLPDLVRPDDLVKLGLAHHTGLFRIRQTGAIPFLKLSNARILYLKADVITWLKATYHSNDVCVDKEENLCSLK